MDMQGSGILGTTAGEEVGLSGLPDRSSVVQLMEFGEPPPPPPPPPPPVHCPLCILLAAVLCSSEGWSVLSLHSPAWPIAYPGCSSCGLFSPLFALSGILATYSGCCTVVQLRWGGEFPLCILGMPMMDLTCSSIVPAS